MTRVIVLILVLLALAFFPLSYQPTEVKVGSKKFTESVILGEVLKLMLENNGLSVTHFRELGGTKLVYQALVNGDIDIYPEYTGTIIEEILAKEDAKSLESIRNLLRVDGISMSDPLGFNNTYVLGMLKSKAQELGIQKISDLRKHPNLIFGFGNEFMDREDGWPNLKQHYGLAQTNVSGLDHDLAYRQLKLGAIDLIDAYATDAKIAIYDLALLEDDLDYFPEYEAVLLYRTDFAESHPEVINTASQLEGSLSEVEIMNANSQVEIDRATDTRAASDFLEHKFGKKIETKDPTAFEQILTRSIEHLDLVRKSLIPAILIAVPLGILAAKYSRFGHVVLAIVGIVQTIPSLALLVILMPFMAYLGLASVGLGSMTAVTALFLYSLLPIVRNTYAGLHSIAGEHLEAAAALGLPAKYRLFEIELPLASRSILAGIKTAAVLNVGFATLGALIGAGGYGQPILTGIRLNDVGLIYQGALPAAVLALLVQGGFDFSERYFIPKGLQLESQSSY